MPTNYEQLFSSINFDDYEERILLEQIRQIDLATEKLEQMPPAMRPPPSKTPSHDPALKASLIAKLGYDPAQGRSGRPRGKARNDAFPQPLPSHGTALRSCLGDTYTVAGYAWAPARVSELPTYVLYLHDGNLIARTLSNLFAGLLATGEPIVTWPDDPRGLKPGLAVPIKFRRQKTREQLKTEREQMDEDRRQAEQAKGRRY